LSGKGDEPVSTAAEVEALLERAETSLAAGRTLLAEGFPDYAAGRAYYAAFYAATAAFLARGSRFKTHSGLLRAVNLHLVRPGLLSADLGRELDWLGKLRVVGDYGQRRHVPEEEARHGLEVAAAVVEALRGLAASA
jgi:uncharacterized protein (UPF0332 family)